MTLRKMNFKALFSNDYDPHLQRHVEHPINNCEAFINLIKCAIGTGCLAMPMAFKHAGWVNGIISTLLISFLVVYALHILLINIYVLCKRHHIPSLSYTDAMSLAIRNGPSFMQDHADGVANLVDFFLSFYHFAAGSVYVVFVAENSKQILDFYGYEMNLRLHMLIYIPIFLGLALLKDLKSLVPFSGVANGLFLTGIAGVLYYVLQDLPPLETREKFKPFHEYPLFFGVVLFSIESVGIIVSIETQMLSPKCYLGWCGILNRGMICVVILYLCFGFLGYWKFGSHTLSSVTLNIPRQDVLSQLIKVLFATAILLSYPLQLMIAKNIIWDGHLVKKIQEENHKKGEIMVRLGIAISTVICAAGLPYLGLLLSLSGSCCLSVLGIICPAIMDICVRYGDGFGRFNFYLIRDYAFIVFGIISGMVGTYVAFLNILSEYYFALAD